MVISSFTGGGIVIHDRNKLYFLSITEMWCNPSLTPQRNRMFRRVQNKRPLDQMFNPKSSLIFSKVGFKIIMRAKKTLIKNFEHQLDYFVTVLCQRDVGEMYFHRSIWYVYNSIRMGRSGLDQLGNTSSRMISEVKQHWARLVLGWETLVQVLPECCC